MTASRDEADAPGVGLVDGRSRNRLLRRERVYRSAIELFVEQGYEQTTMEDISARAQVARATVFNHFQRKSTFLDEWSARRRQRAIDAVREGLHAGQSLVGSLRRYMSELADNSERTRDETVALIGSAIRSTDTDGNLFLAGEIADLVRAGQQKGEVRDDIVPERVGLIVAASYLAILERWILDPPPFHLESELLAMVDVVLDGIGCGRA